MGSHIPVDKLEPMVDSVADQFKSLIMSVSEGKTEIEVEPGTPPVNVGAMIAGIMGDLYCLKEIENVDSISDVLLANNLNYENEIVRGKWSELTGSLDNAKDHYQAAHRQKPDDAIPVYQVAMTELRLNKLEAAESEFNKYLQLAPDDIGAYAKLAGIYEKQKKFDKLVGAYDSIYKLNPGTIGNKPMGRSTRKPARSQAYRANFFRSCNHSPKRQRKSSRVCRFYVVAFARITCAPNVEWALLPVHDESLTAASCLGY